MRMELSAEVTRVKESVGKRLDVEKRRVKGKGWIKQGRCESTWREGKGWLLQRKSGLLPRDQVKKNDSHTRFLSVWFSSFSLIYFVGISHTFHPFLFSSPTLSLSLV